MPPGKAGVNWNALYEHTASNRLIDYVGGTNPIYIGKAQPGTATSDPLWQICKLTFDVNNNVTAIQYAIGAASAYGSFDYIWDNRASLTYS